MWLPVHQGQAAFSTTRQLLLPLVCQVETIAHTNSYGYTSNRRPTHPVQCQSWCTVPTKAARQNKCTVKYQACTRSQEQPQPAVKLNNGKDIIPAHASCTSRVITRPKKHTGTQT